MLSWQKILSSRQSAPDKEERLASQGEILRTRGEISHIHLSLSSKQKPCHGAINSQPRNLRTALEKYFQFHRNCKQLRIEARNSMSNCGIDFPIFFETIQVFLGTVLGSAGRGYCEKRGC